MKNKIEDLRNHLFETIEMLKEDDKRMTVEKAKVISEVAQTIVNTAKVEVDYLRATEQHKGTGFIDLEPKKPSLPGNGVVRALG